MFKDTAGKRAPVTDTLIGRGTVVEGKIESEAGLRIEGEYRGDIACKGDVIIGEYGVARSSIEARDVTVAGRVYGDVKSSGKLTITASGQLHGSFETGSLVVVEGALLCGECRMEQPQKHKAALGVADDMRKEAKGEKERQAG